MFPLQTLLYELFPKYPEKIDFQKELEEVVNATFPKLNFHKIEPLLQIATDGEIVYMVNAKNNKSICITIENWPGERSLMPNIIFNKEALYSHTAHTGVTVNVESCLKIERGNREFTRYVPSVDWRINEYDYTGVAFEGDSEYQNVKIMKSKQFGGMLLLDGDPNLAESDYLYTQAICGHGDINYQGKNVLILGGGDGAILKYLFEDTPKELQPKHAEMVDIDRMVMEQARIHMRGACGATLDRDDFSGENYTVHVDDCFKYLNKYIIEGTKFDIIINDLTACPAGVEGKDDQDMWKFVKSVFDLSMQCLSPEGAYFTQGNGKNAVEALKIYEETIIGAHKLDFKRWSVMVPSYLELWEFYKIWWKND